MIRGTLIAESLRPNHAFQRIPLRLRKLERVGPLPGLTPGQPDVWTFIEFTADEDIADELADSLAACLDDELGWYCDFRTDSETFVVFAAMIFRYRRGDAAGRAQAAAYARQVGLPERQIDWPD